jgi:hypothetical protein
LRRAVCWAKHGAKTLQHQAFFWGQNLHAGKF